MPENKINENCVFIGCEAVQLAQSERLMSFLDYIRPECKDDAARVLGHSPVIGFYLEVLKKMGLATVDMVGCQIREVKLGWFVLVEDSALDAPSHQYWHYALRGGGTPEYMMRSGWRLCGERGVQSDAVKIVKQVVQVYHFGDELVDVVEAFYEVHRPKVAQLLGSEFQVSDFMSLYHVWGRPWHELSEYALREVALGRFRMVSVSGMYEDSHQLWQRCVRDQELVEGLGLLRGHGQQRAALRVEPISEYELGDGYCYLHLVQPEARSVLGGILGAYPKLARLLEYSECLLDGASSRLAAESLDGLVVHVQQEVEDERLGLRPVGSLSLQAVVGGVSPGQKVKNPKLRDVDGQLDQVYQSFHRGLECADWTELVVVEDFGLSSPLAFVNDSARYRPVSLDHTSCVRYATVTTDFVGGRGVAQFVVCPKGQCVVLMLPPGVKLDVNYGSALIGVEEYGTCVVVSQPGIVRVRTSKEQVSALYCNYSRVSVGWSSSFTHHARTEASVGLYGWPSLASASQDLACVAWVDLHDTLDDWRVFNEYRAQFKVRQDVASVKLSGTCGSEIVLGNFLSSATQAYWRVGPVLIYDKKFQLALAVLGSRAPIHVDSMGLPNYDQVSKSMADASFRIRAIADDYAYDCQYDSDMSFE